MESKRIYNLVKGDERFPKGLFNVYDRYSWLSYAFLLSLDSGMNKLADRRLSMTIFWRSEGFETFGNEVIG